MPRFRVVIETRDGWERVVTARDADDARSIIEAEDNWTDPEAGWERTDDCYSAIERIEEVEAQ